MVNDFWLKNKHTISIFQAQVRDLAKHIEAQPKKHNAYIKKIVQWANSVEKHYLVVFNVKLQLKIRFETFY